MLRFLIVFFPCTHTHTYTYKHPKLFLKERAQGNFQRWWISLLPWLWWWIPECMHMSKLIKLCVFNVYSFVYNSVQFSHSVVSDSLRPHEIQHARPPCPSPTPRVHYHYTSVKFLKERKKIFLSRWCLKIVFWRCIHQ